MIMKKTGQAGVKGQAKGLTGEAPSKKTDRARVKGPTNGQATEAFFDLQALLYGLQAISAGEFSVRLPGHWTGLEGKIADTFNEIVAANQKMARELKRVGQVVGKEGKTRQRARFDQSKGAWCEMEVSVNTLIDDLLRPTTEVTRAIAAVAQGNLTQTVQLDVDGRPLEGEFLRSATIVNTMIQQLGVFTAEVTRVAREVGSDGKLGGQAQVPGVGGTWKDLTDNVNSMASNLTAQVRNIAEVTIAVANGDLSRKITVDVRGEILQLKEAINTMVDQLRSFASEVTRVAREVGTDGKLGGQAQVLGVAGTWKDLTDSVNAMAGNLTAQVRNIAEVTTAVARGDLSRKITVDVSGEILELKNTINTMVDQLNAFAGEVTRVAREVGTEGKLGGQAQVPGVAGTWKDLTDNVNSMASNLTAQVRNIAEVTTAVARGDLSRKITVDVSGEILELKNTINTMVDQLNAFAGEVTRVARDVGTEGKLGGQAQVPGVGGTWKDLTDNVNFMAANLTEQVRGIVKVVTAVANGDLTQKLTVNAKGEVAALAETINNMTDTLATFADQVTTVAREVGVEGRLGGQANVPGASGTWKDLTGNVNLLADNLTNQVRAIAEVATAVTQGDLTRSIQVEASGEVADLKDNINTMIDNLRLTTDHNTEQDWLKTNLARLTGMLQGQRDLATVGRRLLSELAPLVNAQQGVIYQMETEGSPGLTLLSTFADDGENGHRQHLQVGEGLIGQCAVEKRRMLLTDLPAHTVPIRSGLVQAVPRNVIVLPVLFEAQVKAVIELASLSAFTASHLAFLEQLTAGIGIVLNSIEATMQTEGLLKQSQQLATELQTQQKELQQTNEQLAQKAQQLVEQNVEVERKNQEIEQARRALEEKAAELALTSKYKSEFLANMSHELRTPLNSILILGQQLGDNPEGNLTPKQVEFARTIHGAGTDLLNLISDILDLSKIESGTVSVEAEEIFFTNLLDMVARPFRHEAENRRLTFEVQLDQHLSRSLVTDSKRLQQVLKNLLSNAFKFTEQGGVRLNVSAAAGGWSADHPILNGAASVVAFEVSDTGIGIPFDKQKIVFEAFQQADAGTSRKFGGTGLGLAISRELAHLLGGEIQLRSTPGSGSTFTLYLPQTYVGSSLSSLMMTGGEAAPTPQPKAFPAVRVSERPVELISDDRGDLQPEDAILLIVEDDPHYARALRDLSRDKGFKVIVAMRGMDALDLARQYRPTAVSLDVFLPDMLGWTVLSHLKQDPAMRHIPVQMVTVDEDRQHGLARGAFSFVTKPMTTEALEAALSQIKEYATPRRKRLLVVEDNAAEQLSITELLGHNDVDIAVADTGEAALAALHEQPFDCVVLDLRLPDMSGFEILESLRDDASLSDVPVVVFTGKELSPEEDLRLHALARSVVVKGVESPERLLDETALFLHRVVANLPPEKQQMLDRLHRSDDDLVGKKVLVVDDDVRNIFALSSVLERRGMVVLTAGTGREAISMLDSTPDLAIVLMDIMMPEMDGYETMQVIRQNPALQRLPIIALTAKAMLGDREKCLDAGASDYLAKPVNTEQLLSALRMWLHR
jgi:CheY-like chemotaxis protein/signal transduction histidine kinase/HAMP domain-containing protein